MERRLRRSLLALALLLAGISGPLALARDLMELGPVQFETRSQYSHIRIREHAGVRSLTFVRDSGEEVIESQINVRQPANLLIPYTRSMFLSYLYQPRPERVLIVGLGGGAMVHFLQHHDPELSVDVVEIDPVVVQAAQEYFGIRGSERVRLFTRDAFEFLPQATDKYDVIYMDAFLKPSEATDTTGVPLNLKTANFYRGVRDKLTPQGIMVFNLNPHPEVQQDVTTIREVFPQSEVYRLNPGQGFVVIGTQAARGPTPRELQVAAAELDRRFRATFSFRTLLRSRIP